MAVVVPVISTFDSRGIDRAIKDFKKLDGWGNKSAMGLLSINKGASQLAKSFAKVTAIGGGLVSVIGSQLVSAAIESRKMMAQTEAIIKATGGAAGITTKQVADLSRKIGEQVGIDDELIQKSANLLLTFKQVKNQVGENNDIFNRAVQASVDLGNVFGSSDAAAKMLGKALSDPIKGITALNRAGVNFTADQKAQIKTLVESGRVLDAQKLILKEVESQVGGTAAATATGFDKMKVSLGNVAEDLGNLLLPYVEQFAGFVQNSVVPVLEDFARITGEEGIGAGITYLTGSIINGIWNMGAFGKAITIVAGAFTALKVATVTYQATMTALNVVTTLSSGAMGQLVKRIGEAKIAMVAAGGVTALLTIAAALYGTYASQKAKAEKRTREFIDALKAEGDAQLQALANLYKSDAGFKNAMDVLKQYGGTIKDLKTYIDTGKGSLTEWSAQVDLVAGDIQRLDEVTQSANPNIDIQGQLYDSLREKLPKLKNATKEQIDAFIAAVKTFQDLRKETVLTDEVMTLFTKGLGVTTTTTTGAGNATETLAEKAAKAAQKFADWKRQAESVFSQQKMLTDASKDSSKAYADLTNATKAVTDAQAKLNQIQRGYGADSAEAKDAQGELTLAQRDAERAGYDLERANFAVKDAEKALNEARAEGDPQAIREAEIALAEAKLSVKDAEDALTASKKAVTDAQTKLNEVTNGATTESNTYKDALAELKSAQDEEMQAVERVNQAKIREFEITKKLTEAQLLLAKAKKKLSKKQIKQAEKALAGLGEMPALVTTPPSQAGIPTLDLSGMDFSGLDLSGFNLGNIPIMGNGGIAMKPTLAMIGESGPEAVVPLNNGAVGGDVYYININSKIADETLPDLLVAELRKFNRRSGAIAIQVA